jgi:putative flippase GtrA
VRFAATLLRKRLFGYILTGGVAALVDLGLFALLWGQGLAVLLAAGLSFAVAMLVNYALSARFVFQQAYSVRDLGKFAAAATFGLVVNTGITALAFSLTELAIPSKIVGIGIAFILNFAINSLIVFRPGPPGR